MTAIADIVSYEREFPLELVHPSTGKKIGVTFWVKHIDCEAATKVSRERAAQPLDNGSPQKEHEQYVACVSRWDWGDKEFEAGGGVLEFSPEKVSYVLHHPGAKWITAQVRNAVLKIGNFTNG